MSNCKITLKIGRTSIEVSVDSSNLPENYNSLKELLIQENKWNNFLEQIQAHLKSGKSIVQYQEIDTLSENSHTITKTNIETLKKRFPTAKFPEDTDELKISDKRVRFMKRYKTVDGKLQYGRLIDEKTGEEVFIVDADHVGQLADYFSFCKTILSDEILDKFTDESEIIKDLKSIYQKSIKNSYLKSILEVFQKSHKDIPNVELKSLLITFVQNKNGFKEITFEKNGETVGAYVYLDELANEILDSARKLKTYNDNQIEALSNSGKWKKGLEEKVYSKSFILDITSSNIKEKINTLVDELNESLKEENKEIRKQNKDLDKEQKQKTKKLYTASSILDKPLSQMENEFSQIFGEDVIKNYKKESTGWNILISEILNKDKSFNLRYSSETAGQIILEKFYATLKSAYGLGFDELQKLIEPIYYNGYYIQERTLENNSKEYYVTKRYTTETQSGSMFMSLAEAQNYIDSLDLEIIDNAYKSLHTMKESDSIEITSESHNGSIGSIITVLDYKVPSFNISDIPEEMRPFLSKNIKKFRKSDFVNFVRHELDGYLNNEIYNESELKNILENINTPEKIFLFISELNNPNYKDGRQIDKSNKSEVIELAESIGSLTKLKHYFVRKISKNGIRYLIPISEEVLPEYRKDRRYPIRSVIDAAQQVLAPRLGGVKMNVITNEEAEELSKASERDISAKAFIMNGEIYINKDLANPEDLFHEYTHILLGYLKNNKDENIRNIYFKLLEEVWELGEQDLERDRIQERTYSDYARIDQMEEYFALKFSKWVKNNSDAKYDIIFSDKALGKAATKLFDPNNYSKSIKELFGSTIETVLLGFNAEIGYFLSKNPTLGDEYKDLFTLSRKKTEWIREQIKSGNLKENNC